MGLTSLFPLDESTGKRRVPYLNRSRNLLGRNNFSQFIKTNYFSLVFKTSAAFSQ